MIEKNCMTFFLRKDPLLIIDQLLHMMAIYIVLLLFQLNPSSDAFVYLFSGNDGIIDNDIKWIMLGILLVLATYASAYFISASMSDLQEQSIEESCFNADTSTSLASAG